MLLAFPEKLSQKRAWYLAQKSSLLALYTLDINEGETLEGTGRGLRDRLVTCIFSFVTFVISPAVVLWTCRVRFAPKEFMA